MKSDLTDDVDAIGFIPIVSPLLVTSSSKIWPVGLEFVAANADNDIDESQKMQEAVTCTDGDCSPSCGGVMWRNTAMDRGTNLLGPAVQPRWRNSPVRSFECCLPDVFDHLPDFERRTLALQDVDGMRSCLNPRLDTIIRKPHGDDPNYVPVGVVSKGYALIPHKEVLRAAANALRDVVGDVQDIRTELAITEYGERMQACLFLPRKYRFEPGGMDLRLELLNSVDGSTQFRALLGWFRFVCSNGLIVGVTKSCLRRRHAGDIGISDIGFVLRDGLADAEQDAENLACWRSRKIDLAALVPWVNGEVKKTWGFKAAARAYHIACSGHDVEIVGKYKGRRPTTIETRRAERVPGCPEKAQNAFDLAQVLSWLASHRTDLQERLEWRQQIPPLMATLIEE